MTCLDSKLVIFASFFIFIQTSLAADCKNPLGEAQNADLLSSPSSSLTGTCPETVLGGSSCCKQSYFDESVDVLLELYDKYASNANYIVAMVTAIDDILDGVYNHIVDKLDDVGSSLDLPSRSSGSSDPEVSTITTGTWQDSTENMDLYIQKCHQNLFDFASAYRCLACDPNYDNYMESIDDSSSSFKIYVHENDCQDLQASCADAAEVMSFFNHKLFLGLYVIFIAEWTENNFDEDYEGPIIKADTVDYLNEAYSPQDEWEVIDLEFKPRFVNCDATEGTDKDFIQNQSGIFGPSVYELMLDINNFQIILEEMIAYGNGDSNVFENSERRRSLMEKTKEHLGFYFGELRDLSKEEKKRLLEKRLDRRLTQTKGEAEDEEIVKTRRRLADRRSHVIELEFTSDENAIGLLDIAVTLGDSPSVDELSGMSPYSSILAAFVVIFGVLLSF